MALLASAVTPWPTWTYDVDVTLPTFTEAPNGVLLVGLGRWAAGDTTMVPAVPDGWTLVDGVVNTAYGSGMHVLAYFNPPAELSGATLTVTYPVQATASSFVAAYLDDAVSVAGSAHLEGWTGGYDPRAAVFEKLEVQAGQTLVGFIGTPGSNDGFAPVAYGRAIPAYAASEQVSTARSGRNIGSLLVVEQATSSGLYAPRPVPVSAMTDPTGATNYASVLIALNSANMPAPPAPAGPRVSLWSGGTEVPLTVESLTTAGGISIPVNS
ncbi:hypothetical protein [Kineococcus esterisolvens]|uniref:hypothetical protein n=1 Tax=unclassified Kineococcus TaxID=2621656 RepID=UPI003D7D16CD